MLAFTRTTQCETLFGNTSKGLLVSQDWSSIRRVRESDRKGKQRNTRNSTTAQTACWDRRGFDLSTGNQRATAIRKCARDWSEHGCVASPSIGLQRRCYCGATAETSLLLNDFPVLDAVENTTSGATAKAGLCSMRCWRFATWKDDALARGKRRGSESEAGAERVPIGRCRGKHGALGGYGWH
jgi:hypothetical protein